MLQARPRSVVHSREIGRKIPANTLDRGCLAVVGDEGLGGDRLIGLYIDSGGLLDQIDGNLRDLVLIWIAPFGDPCADEVLVEACRTRTGFEACLIAVSQ